MPLSAHIALLFPASALPSVSQLCSPVVRSSSSQHAVLWQALARPGPFEHCASTCMLHGKGNLPHLNMS